MLSTRSETKAAVAERAIRSLKNIIYRFIEENGHKYLVKMSSFLNTMNSRVRISTGKAPKEVKNEEFLSFFATRQYKIFGIKWGIKYEFRNTIFLLKKDTSHSSRVKSLKLLRLLLTNLQHTTSRESRVMKY